MRKIAGEIAGERSRHTGRITTLTASPFVPRRAALMDFQPAIVSLLPDRDPEIHRVLIERQADVITTREPAEL